MLPFFLLTLPIATSAMLSPPVDFAAVPPLLTNGAAHYDNDGWEYEYDDEETEDIYFTLDLTTHVPNALVRKQFLPPAPHATNANESDDSIIQITDLHTDRPLVKLDNGVYTCTWTTDLGTQFHISEAGVTEDPFRPGIVLDIVGTSQTRLLGRPVDLQPRSAPSESAMTHCSSNNVVTIDDGNDSEADREEVAEPELEAFSPGLQTAPGQQLRIPRDLCKEPAGEAQASFLERLSEIKLKKGEKDIIPIYGVRTYDIPYNADTLRQEGLAADEERERLSKDAQLAATSQRPHKRRHRLTYAEQGRPTKRPYPASGRRRRGSPSGDPPTQTANGTGQSPNESSAPNAGPFRVNLPANTPQPWPAMTDILSPSYSTENRPQPAERFDAKYVADHPDETFHHRGKGQWVRGLPPPGLNSKAKVAVKGPGAKEWSERLETQKKTNTPESESEYESG